MKDHRREAWCVFLGERRVVWKQKRVFLRKSNLIWILKDNQEFVAFGGEQGEGHSRQKEQKSSKELIVHYILTFQC